MELAAEWGGAECEQGAGEETEVMCTLYNDLKSVENV